MELLVNLLQAVGTVGGLGIAFGVILAVSSKLLAVEKDERVERLENVLPGLNCGICGYAGCASYAEALTQNETEFTKCAPGGEKAAKAIAEVLGVSIDVNMVKKVAQVHCRGGKTTAQYVFDYQGVKDCNALFAMHGGNKACPYGCLGQGSCIAVCPVNAISYDADGLVWVDKEKCISCEKCVSVCPTHVIKMIPYDADVLVACNSIDKGPVVKKYCSVGCIGCKICSKQSPEGGFVVDNFLAVIDYSQKGDREAAMEKCPSHCIIRNKSQIN
ncbi:MAG: RnfABCDGE type electron transport complex subunit B [Spirochaetales bacterium]|nr:RnfABCDGE type electron transport complex subunit B [Spirochaetales bacterium]